MPLFDNAWYVDSVAYAAVPAWAASTAKVCGALIRQLTTPAVNSERVFVCISSTGGTGQTGGTEPTWTLTRGVKITDNTVTWQEATGQASLNGDLTNTPNWNTIKNNGIVLGQVIKSGAGDKLLICTTAGTSGSGSEPSWAAFTNAGATTADNTVTWTTLAAVPSGFTKWSAPHAKLNPAFAATWGQAGNIFYVGDDHNETAAAALTLVSPGTAANPCKIYCVDHTGSTPPVSADLKTTAQITYTGAFSVAFGGYVSRCYGIKFSAGGGGVNSCLITGVGSAHGWVWDTCQIILASTRGDGNAAICPGTSGGSSNEGLWRWINTTVKFGATGQYLAFRSGRITFEWLNTPAAIDPTGSTPTNLFTADGGFGGGANAKLIGVDLSLMASKTLLAFGPSSSSYQFIGCRFATSMTVTPAPLGISNTVDVIDCDVSGGSNWRSERYMLEGTMLTEGTVVRTGGASDGTKTVAWRIFTTASARQPHSPFEALPIEIWNDTTGSPITVTLYGTSTSGATPTNNDIWFEAQYMSSASYPLMAKASCGIADDFATPTNHSSDGSTWGGGTTPFKMSLTFTPQMKGPIILLIKAARPSFSSYYIDPEPEISGVTVSKSFMLPPGVYANELQSGGSGVAGYPASRLQLGH